MRILTYNTRGSLGMDNVRSTRRIAETIRPYSADVVCFQEIHKRLPWSQLEDQPAVLSKLLNRRFIFQCNVGFGPGAYGIGISTRGDVTHIANHFLPGDRERRGVLEVELRLVGGLREVTVFCTHWGLDSQERVEQAKALVRLVQSADSPVIVCGDLNERPQGDAVRLLLAETGLVDVDAVLNRPTFAADKPNVRIDYCLHSPVLKSKAVEVGTSQASDHLPLVVDLTP